MDGGRRGPSVRFLPRITLARRVTRAVFTNLLAEKKKKPKSKMKKKE
jgi:hypothetical protein